jgi:hypothetical protein
MGQQESDGLGLDGGLDPGLEGPRGPHAPRVAQVEEAVGADTE